MMNKNKQHKYLSILLIALFIICKYWLRPLKIQNEAVNFFLGIAPNFFASMGIPMFAFWNYKSMTATKFANYNKWLPYFLVLFFIGFIIEEVKPTFANSQHFDWFDILFSGTGILIFYRYHKKYILAN